MRQIEGTISGSRVEGTYIIDSEAGPFEAEQPSESDNPFLGQWDEEDDGDYGIQFFSDLTFVATGPDGQESGQYKWSSDFEVLVLYSTELNEMTPGYYDFADSNTVTWIDMTFERQ